MDHLAGCRGVLGITGAGITTGWDCTIHAGWNPAPAAQGEYIEARVWLPTVPESRSGPGQKKRCRKEPSRRIQGPGRLGLRHAVPSLKGSVSRIRERHRLARPNAVDQCSLWGVWAKADGQDDG